MNSFFLYYQISTWIVLKFLLLLKIIIIPKIVKNNVVKLFTDITIFASNFAFIAKLLSIISTYIRAFLNILVYYRRYQIKSMKFICTLVLICTAFANFVAANQNKAEVAYTCKEVENMKDSFLDNFS